MQRFIVTGCPRSGTMYAAKLFGELGVRMGHEDVFGVPQGLGGDPRWQDYQADSSWLAVPHLPLDDVVVLHQVRHPLEFVRSVVAFTEPGFLSDERAKFPFSRVVRRHAPEVYAPATQAERAATMWRVWNDRAQRHAGLTYRLEDFDAALLLRLCRLVELDVTSEQAEGALARLSKTTNRTQRDESVEWEDIAPIVGDAADLYGYKSRV